MSDGGDSFTEHSSQGWLSRMGDAIKGVVVGLILFVVSFPLLFWNEGRAVQTRKSLEEGAAAVVPVPDAKVDPSNDGRLIHTTGEATTKDTLTDPDFGVAANAIRLSRSVEIYQWHQKEEKETKKKLGGGTETQTKYTYEKSWVKEPIDSSKFKKPEEHDNHGTSLPAKNLSLTAAKVTLGGFDLPNSLVNQITSSEKLPADETKLPADQKSVWKVSSGQLYKGKDPAKPDIGDVHIDYSVIKPAVVSILARQVKNTLEPFPTLGGKGDNIELLSMGTKSADAMFTAAQQANVTLTWILRLVGFLVMAVGIYLVFAPLVTMADVLPFLGNLLGMGVGLIAGLVAFCLSAVTIGIAWVYYRPIIGIPLLVVGIGGMVGLFMLARKRQAAAAAK
jgi:hypothetical protein